MSFGGVLRLALPEIGRYCLSRRVASCPHDLAFCLNWLNVILKRSSMISSTRVWYSSALYCFLSTPLPFCILASRYLTAIDVDPIQTAICAFPTSGRISRMTRVAVVKCRAQTRLHTETRISYRDITNVEHIAEQRRSGIVIEARHRNTGPWLWKSR